MLFDVVARRTEAPATGRSGAELLSCGTAVGTLLIYAESAGPVRLSSAPRKKYNSISPVPCRKSEPPLHTPTNTTSLVHVCVGGASPMHDRPSTLVALCSVLAPGVVWAAVTATTTKKWKNENKNNNTTTTNTTATSTIPPSNKDCPVLATPPPAASPKPTAARVVVPQRHCSVQQNPAWLKRVPVL